MKKNHSIHCVRQHRAPVLEALELRRMMSATSPSSPLTVSATTEAAIAAPATLVAPQRVFLTGNSMTDGVRYAGLAQLLARDGAPVSLGRQTGPGYSQADNFALKAGYYTSGLDPAQPDSQDPWGNYQQALTHTWDTLTLQPHDRRLLKDYAGGTTNQADVPMTVAFMQQFAAASPGAQVFAYSRPVRRTDVDAGNKHTGATFNYSSEWLKSYVDSGTGMNGNYITRSYVQQFMPLARSAQQADPAAGTMKPLRLIPVGEAYYNIDQMIKADKFAGTHVTSIQSLYIDQSHPNATASYVIALTFYASITGNDPRGVAPTSSFVTATPALADAKVQALLQQSVYDAMSYGGYTGWTTPMPAPATQPAAISGNIFSDTDSDGVRDSGEAALSGWTVFLDLDKDRVLDAGESARTTDAAGAYAFTELQPGDYSIVLQLKSGYTPTQPTGGTHAVKVAAGQVLGGVNFGARPATGSISGTLFNDQDADGVKDSGEVPLATWKLFIDSDKDGVLDIGEKTAVTDAAGNYWFSSLNAGSYRVREVMSSGWRYTSPSSGYHDVTLTAGQNTAGRNFGNTQRVKISGTLWNDLDADSVRDAGEAALSGWRVYLDSDKDGVFDSTERSTFTSSSGGYGFSNLAAGSYRLRTVSPSGWRPSSSAWYYDLTLASGAAASRNFAWTQKIMISGSVFNDLDRDRVRDSGEAGLANWRVFIDRDGDGVLDFGEISVLSDSAGNYSFKTLSAGTHQVRVVQQSGWSRTTPSTGYHSLTVASGGTSTGKLFGQTRVV